MSTELREAADRLRRLPLPEDHPYMSSNADLMWRDRELTSDAYIDLVPADDNIPVTVEWCDDLFQEAGWGRNEKMFFVCASVFIRFEACAGGWSQGKIVIGQWVTKKQATRGNVRRLEESLDITLKENQNGN